MRPQLATWPNMAVFTSGEFATVRAAASASHSSAAPATRTVMSPLSTISSTSVWSMVICMSVPWRIR